MKKLTPQIACHILSPSLDQRAFDIFGGALVLYSSWEEREWATYYWFLARLGLFLTAQIFGLDQE